MPMKLQPSYIRYANCRDVTIRSPTNPGGRRSPNYIFGSASGCGCLLFSLIITGIMTFPTENRLPGLFYAL